MTLPLESKSIARSLTPIGGSRPGIGLVPFVPAGYPDLAATPAVIRAMDAAGAAAIEVGFPFSDPIADGPTIQQAFTAALAHKLKVAEIFQAVQNVSGEISAPLIAMVSFSIVYRHGPERFFDLARRSGFAGIILPDLPPPQAKATCDQIRAAGLETILLVAPTTPPDRRRQIAELCTGFVYYLSVSGITGARDDLPTDIAENVKQLRTLTDRPICVGFGISKARHLRQLAGIADGAIVGSAIVRRMIEHAGDGPAAIAQAVGQYCRELRSI